MAQNGSATPTGLQRFLLPPDFDPARRIDAGTWVEAIFEPAVLIAAIVCFVIGIVQFGTAFAPDWPTRFLPPLAVVVAVEGFGYVRRVGDTTIRPKEWLVLLVPVLVLARLLPYLDDPNSSLLHDAPTWIGSPGLLFTLGFVADSLILLLVWWLTLIATDCLNGLRVQPGEVPDESDPLARHVYEDNFRAVDHTEPLRKLAQFYIGGGITLVVLTGLAALGTNQIFGPGALAELIGFQRPSLQLIQVNVVLFFVLGLLLLGEAHFVRQRTLWRLDRIEMPTEVQTQWVGGVIGLVLLTAVIAFLLPTQYAMTLGDIVTYLIGLVLQAFYAVVGLFFFLLYLIFSLFGRGSAVNTPPTPAMPRPPVHAAPPPSHGSPLDTVQSIVFWLVATGIVAYSLGVIWRKRGGVLGNVHLLPLLLAPWRIFQRIAKFLGQLGREVSRVVVAVVPRIFRAAPAPTRAPFRFVSLGRMNARQLVEYFYLSIGERAGRLGYPRPAGMTPEEYERLIQERLPEVGNDFAELTAAFVEARYGPRPTTPDDAKSVRTVWQALKTRLRKVRLARLS